jgi:subtilisin family serine protease
MACPHVSGVAALVLSRNPSYSPDDVRKVLRISAEDVDTPGWDEHSGYGRINAYNAIQINTIPQISSAITLPVNGAEVKGQIEIIGTADASNFRNFKRYRRPTLGSSDRRSPGRTL